MTDTLSTCSCGHDVGHHAVGADLKFSFWGQFALIILGITARPKKATWQCQRCGEVVKETRDLRELDALR